MKKILLTLMILMAILIPTLSFAQVEIDRTLKPEFAVSITPPAGNNNSAAVATIALQLFAGSLFYIAGPIAVLLLAIAGFRYVISRGDQNQIDEAKKNIMWTLLGLAVMALSLAIVTSIIGVLKTTGIN